MIPIKVPLWLVLLLMPVLLSLQALMTLMDILQGKYGSRRE